MSIFNYYHDLKIKQNSAEKITTDQPQTPKVPMEEGVLHQILTELKSQVAISEPSPMCGLQRLEAPLCLIYMHSSCDT